MRIKLTGIQELEKELRKQSLKDFKEVGDDMVGEMFNRASTLTPLDTGELRLSRSVTMTSSLGAYSATFGYTKDYGPHVEYGHRTKSGAFVSGQYYLRANVEAQRPLYKQRLKEELSK